MADDVEAFLLGKIAEGVLQLVVCGVRGAEAEAGTVRREDDMLGVELEERLLMRAADTEPRPRPDGLDGLVGRHLQRAEGPMPSAGAAPCVRLRAWVNAIWYEIWCRGGAETRLALGYTYRPAALLHSRVRGSDEPERRAASCTVSELLGWVEPTAPVVEVGDRIRQSGENCGAVIG
ncbi:hypothetical protein ACCO45_010186 [Purpureocillium lilacinum]|uniref:Uncharacterized protein n=1 Tax=Purpureocillium lilacinum TaxID=33203 RepID=A0ACC4DH36_PURLI